MDGSQLFGKQFACFPVKILFPGLGFEPRINAPEASVLPLHHPGLTVIFYQILHQKRNALTLFAQFAGLFLPPFQFLFG